MAVLSCDRMLNYLPAYWQVIEEMKRILYAEGIELDGISETSERIMLDAFIMTASESRIAEWEKWLNLPPTGTLEERRWTVLQYFAVISKLTDQSIKTLVASLYNGARAVNRFEDSTIKIIVVPLPEHFMDEFDFSLLHKQLSTRKPCHIGVTAERGFSDWGDVKENFNSWGNVKSKFKTWEEVLMYIPR